MTILRGFFYATINYSTEWRVGGAVTQRSAKPCRRVRLPYVPPVYIFTLFLMSELVITSRPVTPDQEAFLILQEDNDFSEFPLSFGRSINISLEDPEEKFCTGWRDIKTSTMHPCEGHEQIPTKYNDCFSCRNKTGFNPAFYNTTTISANQEEFNKQPHLVYIASFGNEIYKAGISAAKRGFKRLYEQGALLFTIVAEAPNATVARNLEAKLVSQNLKESVLKSTKSSVLMEAIDIQKEHDQFKAFLEEMGYGHKTITSNLEMFFDGDYPNEPIKPFKDDQAVSGVIKGVVGRYLILENNERLYGVWLSDYFGRKIFIGDQIELLDREAQQVSLF